MMLAMRNADLAMNDNTVTLDNSFRVLAVVGLKGYLMPGFFKFQFIYVELVLTENIKTPVAHVPALVTYKYIVMYE